MKKKFISLLLVLSFILQYGLITAYASGLDPYIGFSATAIDDYKCDRASFTTTKKLGGIWAGDWACYKELDFGETSPTSVEVQVGVPEGYSKAIELRIDSPEGTRIALVPITPSGSFSVPEACRAELEKAVTGVHDLYITNANSTSDIYEIKFFKPREVGSDIPKYDNSDAFSDIADDVNKREINLLYQLGMLREYDENKFDPLLPVTRGEFAYSVFKLYGVSEVDGAYGTVFSDVGSDKYYAQAVAYLTNMGIINGVTADLFRPDDFIRHIDALTIICRVLGWDKLAAEIGGYPQGYIKIASDEKIVVSGIGTYDYLRRTDMAKLIYNAFDSDGLELSGIRNGVGDYDKIEGLLYRTQELYIGFGKVENTYLSGLYSPKTDVNKNKVVIDGFTYESGKTNASAMLGYDCEFFYTEESDGSRTLRAIVPEKNVKITEISQYVYDISAIDDDEIVYYTENGKKKKIEIKSNTAVLYNGVAIDAALSDFINPTAEFCGTVTLIENGDGVDTVIVDEYVNHIVDSVNTTDGFFTDYETNRQIDMNSDNAWVFIKKGDELVTISDLAEEDVVSLYASKNRSGKKYVRAYVSTNEISGEISKHSSSDGVAEINGIEYRVSPYCTSELGAGLKGIFRLDVNGDITAWKFAEISERKIGLYLDGKIEEKGIDKKAKIKLVTQTGKTEILSFADVATVDGLSLKNSADIINGNATYGGIASLTKEKPVRYSLNDKNEVVWIDTLLSGSGGSDDTLSQLTDGDNVRHNWENGIMAIEVSGADGSYMIGQYYLPSSSAMITYFDGARSEDEKWAISKIGNTMGESTYPKGEAYSTFGSKYSGDLFVWRNRSSSTSWDAPFVFTGMTVAMNDNGDTVYNVNGVDGKAVVSYILTSESYNSGILKDVLPGDTIRVKRNEEKEIFEAEYLVFRDAADARGTSTPTLTKTVRLSTGTNRDERFIFGKVLEKDADYIAIDLASLTVDGTDKNIFEIIERTSASVVEVTANGRGGTYSAEHGLTVQNISADDIVFAYLNDGATKLVVIYKDVTLE